MFLAGGLDQAQKNSRRRGRKAQPGRGGASTPNKGGLFGLSFLNFGAKGKSEAGKKQSDSVYYLLIAALFFGILYWAYANFYEGAARKHRNARLSYEQALSSNNTAWRQLKERPSKMKDLALRAKQDVDKVLWSEKCWQSPNTWMTKCGFPTFI